MQINNNNNNIKQENKKLKLEEKNKQNSSINSKKILGYTGLSVVGVAAFGIAGKVIWDKLKKNDNNNSDQKQDNQFKNNDNVMNWQGLIRDYNIKVGSVYLTPAVQRWIRSFMILLMQQYPLCWHNASMQYLACPEIMFGEEEYEQEFHGKYPPKIKSMIDWMRNQIETQKKDKNLKIEDYFTSKILKFVPASVREVPDGFEHFIPQKNDTSTGPLKLEMCDFMFRSNPALPGQIFGGKFNGVNFSERIANIDEKIGASDIVLDAKSLAVGKLEKINLDTIDYIMKKNGYIKNRNKSFTLGFPVLTDINPNVGKGLDMESIGQISNLIFRPCGYGFKPTFIASWLQGHYSVFYFLYSGIGELQCVIWANGSNQGLEVLTIDEFCDKLSQETHNFKNGGFFVRYSPENIVKRYYTPELMFNANK